MQAPDIRFIRTAANCYTRNYSPTAVIGFRRWVGLIAALICHLPRLVEGFATGLVAGLAGALEEGLVLDLGVGFFIWKSPFETVVRQQDRQAVRKWPHYE